MSSSPSHKSKRGGSPFKRNAFFESIEILENEHWVAQSFKGQGDFEFEGNLRFNGAWKGSIKSKRERAHLFIQKGSKFSGNIDVAEVSVEGDLADVELTAKVFRALPGSRIFGRVKAEKIIIEEGALVQGRLVTITPAT